MNVFASQSFPEVPSDKYQASNVNFRINFIRHASLFLEIEPNNGSNFLIYLDPVSDFADFSTLPKADFILITHEHSDHFDPKAIDLLIKNGTRIISSETVAEALLELDPMSSVTALRNGDDLDLGFFKLQVVPAYNTTRPQFHPKGRGNGYVIEIGDKRIYIAGDCEDMPEMKSLKAIDIAFLPVNQPYTMTEEQAVQAVQMIQPKVFYPYHFGQVEHQTDLGKLKELLKNQEVEVILRNMP